MYSVVVGTGGLRVPDVVVGVAGFVSGRYYCMIGNVPVHVFLLVYSALENGFCDRRGAGTVDISYSSSLC